MTTVTMQGAEPPIWLRLPAVAAIVVALAALKLAIGAQSGLSFDEGYYTLWSRGLSVGYFDHPPAVAALIVVGRSLLGDNALGVRLFAVLCHLGICAALWRTGTLLLGRAAAGLATLLYALAPVSGLAFLMTPDPPSVLCWMATVWLLAEFSGSQRGVLLLLAGAIFGLGLWSKYTDAFLAPGVLLWLVADGRVRPWLRRWQVWAAIILALLVFSPVIWWNAQHDWASFRFQGQRTISNGPPVDSGANFVELLAGQALFMGPLLMLAALCGIAGYWLNARREGWSGLSLLVWTTLPGLAYFAFHTLHGRVEANWPMPLWPPLTLIAAWMGLRLWQRWPRLSLGLGVVQMLFGVALAAFVYVQLLFQPFALGGGDRTNETRGWPALQQAVSAAAKANGAHWVATAGNFALTGELASYFAFAGDPLPVRQVDEPLRWTFLPPLDGDALGWPALFITSSPEAAARLFGQVKPVVTLTRDNAHGPVDSYSLFLVSDPTSAFMTAEGL